MAKMRSLYLAVGTFRKVCVWNAADIRTDSCLITLIFSALFTWTLFSLPNIYNVIKTIENDTVQLCIVPTAWEKDAVLYWPTKSCKDSKKLIRDSEPVPQIDWDKIPCSVKEADIESLKTANKLCSLYSNLPDSVHPSSSIFFIFTISVKLCFYMNGYVSGRRIVGTMKKTYV